MALRTERDADGAGERRKGQRERTDLDSDWRDRTHDKIYCHILRTWAYLYYENMQLTCDVCAAPSPLVRAHLSCLLCGLCSDGGFVPATVWRFDTDAHRYSGSRQSARLSSRSQHSQNQHITPHQGFVLFSLYHHSSSAMNCALMSWTLTYCFCMWVACLACSEMR